MSTFFNLPQSTNPSCQSEANSGFSGMSFKSPPISTNGIRANPLLGNHVGSICLGLSALLHRRCIATTLGLSRAPFRTGGYLPHVTAIHRSLISLLSFKKNFTSLMGLEGRLICDSLPTRRLPSAASNVSFLPVASF